MATSTIGIYLGGAPRYEYASLSGDDETAPAVLLGSPVEWHLWSAHEAFGAETIFPATCKPAPKPLPASPSQVVFKPPGEELHVFLEAPSKEAVAELRALVAKMHVDNSAPSRRAVH